MTDLFGAVGIAPGIAIILLALALGAMAVLKIQDMIRQRASDGDTEVVGRVVRKQIASALSTHLLKLEAQRSEWALDAQRAREQHDREFRSELWAVVDAIREALDEFGKGAA